MQNIEYVQANAQYLPFEDNTFDIVTIAFGLRNVTDKDMALRSIYRSAKTRWPFISTWNFPNLNINY